VQLIKNFKSARIPLPAALNGFGFAQF
jgi:hypothetical protein